MRNISRSILFLVALVVFSGASATTARAQDSAAKKTKTPSEAVLESWNDVGVPASSPWREDWPEDKYTYKKAHSRCPHFPAGSLARRRLELRFLKPRRRLEAG